MANSLTLRNGSLTSTEEPVTYVEAQRRRRGWILSLICAVLGIVYLFQVANARDALGATTNLGYWLWFGVWVPLWLWRPSMRTLVRGGVLELRFSRFHVHRIEVQRITSVEEVTYYPAIDGGWGVRKGRALRIHAEGEEDFLLIGTARPAELRRALGRG